MLHNNIKNNIKKYKVHIKAWVFLNRFKEWPWPFADIIENLLQATFVCQNSSVAHDNLSIKVSSHLTGIFMMTGVIRVRSDVELTLLFQIRLTYIPWRKWRLNADFDQVCLHIVQIRQLGCLIYNYMLASSDITVKQTLNAALLTAAALAVAGIGAEKKKKQSTLFSLSSIVCLRPVADFHKKSCHSHLSFT